jgi:uncharacterized membrane-anchored protein
MNWRRKSAIGLFKPFFAAGRTELCEAEFLVRKRSGEAMVKLPTNHPLRNELNNEVHARPPEALGERAAISYLVLIGDRTVNRLTELCERFSKTPPHEGVNHFSADMGEFRLKWERHTEFTRYAFMIEPDRRKPVFSETALSRVPGDWLEKLKGEILVADHLTLVPGDKDIAEEVKQVREYFGDNALIGAQVSGAMGSAYTDFQIHKDGFLRFLFFDRGMTAWQRGRAVQRLLELDTYRMMALLTLPVARSLMEGLSKLESELNAITSSMRAATESQQPELLDRLTLLHADIVNRHTSDQFRFSAARAYSDLVSRRTAELRQSRIEGLQTFSEFIERRLSPAMRTCEAADNRLNALSERVSHATQLLSTRVDIVRENQNQSLLESMNRRAKLQLRLQETVEGLSTAAITYYIVGLVSYMAAGFKELGLLPVDKSVVTMLSIPVVLVLVAFGVRRLRKALFQ